MVLVDLRIVGSELSFYFVCVNILCDTVEACLAVFVNRFDYDLISATLCLDDLKFFIDKPFDTLWLLFTFSYVFWIFI